MPLSGREQLVVYQRALDLATELHAIARVIPSTQRDLKDQLRRAANSVVLNLAEGSDEFKPREKSRFYRMARRSASECGAILDILERIIPARPRNENARVQLQRVLEMTTALVKSMDGERTPLRRVVPGTGPGP